MTDDFSGIDRSVAPSFVLPEPWALTRADCERAFHDMRTAEYEPAYFHPVGRPADGYWTWVRRR